MTLIVQSQILGGYWKRYERWLAECRRCGCADHRQTGGNAVGEDGEDDEEQLEKRERKRYDEKISEEELRLYRTLYLPMLSVGRLCPTGPNI